MNQLPVYTQLLCFGFSFHLGCHRALNRVPCVIRQVLVSFFKLFIFLIVCLCLTALGLRCCGQAYSGCAECGLFIALASTAAEHRLQDKHRLKYLQRMGFVVRCAGLVAQQHAGSFQTRGRIGVPCTGRQILYQWTTRVVRH